jgi:hypothetical protein
VAGGVREGACPGHNFTIAPIPPTPRSGRLQLCTASHAPLACVVAVIRWGPNTSSDKLRRCARCTACGNKGATIQHPGWGGNDVGFLPFPVEKLAAH